MLVYVLEAQPLFVGAHRAAAHAHRREAAVVEEVLHRHLARQIREERQHVIGAVVRRGVAQRRHALRELHEVFEPQHAVARGGRRRRLRHGIDAHVLLAAVDIAETAGDRFEQRLGVGHVVVAVERALCGDVAQRHDRTPFAQGVFLAQHLDHLVERNGRYVERLLQVIVVQVVVGAALAYVGRHADRVEREVERPAEVLHRLVHEVFQIGHRRGVGRDDRSVAFGRQFVERSHAQRHGGIGQHDLGALFDGAFGYLPCDRLLVERAENDSFLPF